MRPSELAGVLPATTSASQLSCYASCPRKYAYRYVEKREPEKRSSNLALGTAFHGAIGWWFEQRIEGASPCVEDAVRILHADLDAGLSVPGVEARKTDEALHEEAECLLRLFLAEHGELDVVEVERFFEMPLTDPDTGEVLPRTLIGYLDLVLRDGRAVELKTARAAYSDIDLRTSLQFGCYRTAQRLFSPYDVSLLALIKTKAPRIQHVDLRPNRSVAARFLRNACDIERAILAGVYPPSPSALCGSCEYQLTCMGEEDDEDDDNFTEAQTDALAA